MVVGSTPARYNAVTQFKYQGIVADPCNPSVWGGDSTRKRITCLGKLERELLERINFNACYNCRWLPLREGRHCNEKPIKNGTVEVGRGLFMYGLLSLAMHDR